MDEITEQRCNRCKVMLPIYKFTKKNDDKYMKSCDLCRKKQQIDREKYKCEHGYQRSQCKVW